MRSRGFIRGAETQATKVINHIDSLLALGISGDTVFVTDTVTVVDTVLVEACPAGWTCTPPDTVPPDTTAIPMPDNVVLMGQVPSSLRIEWSDPPADIDSIVVDGGKNAGGGNFSYILPATDTMLVVPLPYDTVTSMWSCVKWQRDGVNGPMGCDSFDWAPVDSIPSGMSYSIDAIRADGFDPDSVTQISVGDSMAISLVLYEYANGEWSDVWATDSTFVQPDSVIFTINGQRHRERVYPYRWNGDDGFYVVPAVDTVRIDVDIYGDSLPNDDGDGHLYLGAAWPLGFGTGDLPDDLTFEEATIYWAENQFNDPTGLRIYYVGDSSAPSSQPQYALGNDLGIVWHYRASFAVPSYEINNWQCMPRGIVIKEYPPIDNEQKVRTPWC